MGTAFAQEWDRHFRISVRNAVQRTFDHAAFMPVEQVYLVLAEELSSRGVDPEPEAVFNGALLISRGRRPAVLGDSGRDATPAQNVTGTS